MNRRSGQFKNARFLFCILLAVVSKLVTAQTNLLKSENGVVSFTSDAPLELINASSESLRGILDIDQNTFAFALDMKTFEGFNSDLQRTHFNENYIESRKYPRATFTGKIIEKIDWSTEGVQDVRAKGFLEVHGVKQERIIPSHLEIFTDRVLIHAEFVVPLKDHNISIPKIVAQKISEKITVSIQLAILRSQASIEE
jgi:hypothetical protein